MIKDFQGKVAFITGSASGIGMGIAHACAKHGMKVCIVDKREAQIKSDLTKAEANRIQSEQLLAEYKTQLAEAKKQASEIVADAKRAAEAAKADIMAAAEAESAQMIAKAKEAIEVERRAAVAGLQQSAADLSIAVAGRFIGQDLSDEEHKRIIERCVEEAGSFNAS